ncbi:MAG: type III pantothenate kinase, partial [Alicyclobacillus sp.]|nr:type III pantothenate kinase [Alicyclobacillus sp.]
MTWLLAIDVGNSNTKIGVYAGTTRLHHWRIATLRQRTSDEMTILMRALFRDAALDLADLGGVIISSVVPSVMPALQVMCQTAFGLSPIVVGPGVKTGLSILGDNPREVGSDRIAAAVCALHRYGSPLIIVDFGT